MLNGYQKISLILFFITGVVLGQRVSYNHPELDWQTFETSHFKVHYHTDTDWTAKESAKIAETIFGPVTSFYDFEPDAKTDLIIWDTDDISNGAAYYYDNKIDIWASPLDFLFRGNHSWLRDVITHEFTHIVSIQKAMKYSRNFPGAYFQVIDYEDEKREDVVHGYPRVIASYPLPGMVLPMWLAEGVAQYQYPGSSNDMWDSHRDMLLRDRVLHNELLSLTEMGSFGKRGVGNESTYNQGYALTKYLAENYGNEVLPKLMEVMSSPVQFSINTALKKATGKSGVQIHQEWGNYLENKYLNMTTEIRQNIVEGEVIIQEGVIQTYPVWSGDTLIYYLSNKGRDYYSLTSLYVYDRRTKESELVQAKVHSKVSVSPDGKFLYYTKKSDPNKYGSKYYDIYKYDLKTEEEEQLTEFRRAYSPVLSPDGTKITYLVGGDGATNLWCMDLESGDEKEITDYDNGIQLFSSSWSKDSRKLAFDYATNHGRDIAIYGFETDKINMLLGNSWDERDPHFDDTYLYYASDQTGIFNIYRKSLTTEKIEALTNVTGGAFMPAVNENDELIYSLYDSLKFKIMSVTEATPIPKAKSIYDPHNAEDSPEIMPVSELDSLKSGKYTDQFSKFFIMPKVMIDYNTVKPGFYFFSSEIINRLNVLGGFGINKDKDRDLALMLEYHQWYPTFYLDLFNISRSISGNEDIIDGYPVKMDYTFSLTEADFGISIPSKGKHIFRFDIALSKYSAINDQEFPTEALYSNGFSYDYYRGINYKLNWKTKIMLPSVNEYTNPNNGFEFNTNIFRNYDYFIQGFDVYEAYGTLKIDFRKNFYWRIDHEGIWHHKYPFWQKLVGNFKWKLGWISKPDVDSFFNFFAGGMPGLKGYPFYSIEGRNLLSLHYTFRLPLFVEKDIQLAHFNLQNCFLATYFETGNAWSRISGYRRLKWDTFREEPVDVIGNVFENFKRDVGFQIQFSGFSFFAYPTAISFDWVYGLDEFQITDNYGETQTYGNEWRTYLTVLFGL